jgi:hypothetical protein
MAAIVLIIGALTYVAVPRLNFGVLYRKQADTIARRIVTDLRRTRSLAISDVASNAQGYRLEMTGSGAYSGYRIVNLDTSDVIDTLEIEGEVSCTGGGSFSFGPLGELKAGSDSSVTVSGPGQSFAISIVSATGMVKCEQN